MILINANNCGVFANKHMIVLFFVVNSPFLLMTGLPVSPNSSEKKPNRCLISERVY